MEKEDASSYYGKFIPMPDFQYLQGKFEEYELLLTSDFQNFELLAELTNWIVELSPRLVSDLGKELPLLSAEIRSLERSGDLVFHGTKLSEDKQGI